MRWTTLDGHKRWSNLPCTNTRPGSYGLNLTHDVIVIESRINHEVFFSTWAKMLQYKTLMSFTKFDNFKRNSDNKYYWVKMGTIRRKKEQRQNVAMRLGMRLASHLFVALMKNVHSRPFFSVRRFLLPPCFIKVDLFSQAADLRRKRKGSYKSFKDANIPSLIFQKIFLMRH